MWLNLSCGDENECALWTVFYALDHKSQAHLVMCDSEAIHHILALKSDCLVFVIFE